MLYNLLKQSAVSIYNNDFYEDRATVDDTINGFGNVYVYDGSLICECDLGSRFDISSFVYGFTSDLDNTTISGTLNFYYKNDINDSYIEHPFTVSGTNYIADFESDVCPRYIRVVHESNTTISGTLYSISCYNFDDIVNFGIDGTYYQESITSATGISIVKAINIYNSGDTVADANASIDRIGSDIDKYVSLSSNGVNDWYGPVIGSKIISFDSNFDKGTFDNVEVYDGKLVLSNVSNIGYYTTPIFYNDDYSSIFIDCELPQNTNIVADDNEIPYTINIRHSETKPTGYSFYRVVNTSGYSFHVYDYNMVDDSLIIDRTISSKISDGGYWKDSLTVFDSVSFKSYSLYLYQNTKYTSQNSHLYIMSIDMDENIKYKRISSMAGYNNMNVEIIKILPESDGGCWCYFMVDNNDSPYEDYTNNDAAYSGYYLIHFDSELSATFNIYNSDSFLIDIDVDYSRNTVWYIESGTNTVFNIDSSGNVLLEHLTNVYDYRCVCCSSDGGVWLHTHDSIKKINYSGNSVKSFSMDKLFSKLFYINDDYLLGVSGNSIYRVYLSDGRLSDSFYISSLEDCHVYGDFLVCKCSDSANRVFNKYTLDLIYTIDYTHTAGFCNVGFIDDGDFIDKFPIDGDAVWSLLEYRDINYSLYKLPSDSYIQFKIGLVGDGVETPSIKSISLSKNVLVEGIAPGSYKPVYFRIYSDDPYIANNYNISLSVWWRVYK